jgi:hypothetical protein
MKTLLFVLAVCGSAATGRSLPFGIDFKMSLKGAVGQDLTLAQKADPIVVLQFENPTLSAVELRIPAHDSAHRKLPYPYALSAKVSDAAEISPTLDKQWMTQYAIWNTTFDENDPADVAVLQPGGHLHFEVPLFDIIGPWYPHGVERSDYRVRIRYEDEVSQEFHVHK